LYSSSTIDLAGEHEQQIRKPVEVLTGGGRDRFGVRQGRDAPFCAPAHGTREMAGDRCA
jgi:hypothetical protein